MDSFELNKIIGAILGTLLFVMGVGFLAEAVYEPRETGPGLSLPVPEGTAVAEGGAEEPAAETPIAVLLASADAEAGQAAARKCQSCHNFAQGSGNKTGPELWNTIGKVIGSHEGFAYSATLTGLHDAGETWTYDNINHFLLAPKEFAPGTKMNFAGLKNEQERANVIAYLASLSDSPVPFPAPEAPAADPAAEAVPTHAEAIDTPTETAGDTPVVGTPVSETIPDAAPAEGAAPAADATEAPATEAPAAMEAPAMEAPAATEAPAAGQ